MRVLAWIIRRQSVQIPCVLQRWDHAYQLIVLAMNVSPTPDPEKEESTMTIAFYARVSTQQQAQTQTINQQLSR